MSHKLLARPTTNQSRLAPFPRATGVVLHKNNEKDQKWERLKETNPVLRTLVDLRRSYDESENPLVSSVRSVTEKIGGLFEENETAQVVRAFRALDPSFDMEGFSRELREYIVPEVVDAYLTADREALKMWCGEAVSRGLNLPDGIRGTD